jgi:hypothetical protein
VVTGVTNLPYARIKAVARYTYTIGVLEGLILHFHGYFITGSSGVAVGGKAIIKEYQHFFSLATMKEEIE